MAKKAGLERAENVSTKANESGASELTRNKRSRPRGPVVINSASSKRSNLLTIEPD